jgi:diaminopimelate decarboxylase
MKTLTHRSLPTDQAPGARRLGRPWPAGAMCTDGALQLGGVDVAELVERYGTPLYVLDENEFRSRARRYRQLFPQARIHYAAKAFLCREVARWAKSEVRSPKGSGSTCARWAS